MLMWGGGVWMLMHVNSDMGWMCVDADVGWMCMNADMGWMLMWGGCL